MKRLAAGRDDPGSGGGSFRPRGLESRQSLDGCPPPDGGGGAASEPARPSAAPIRGGRRGRGGQRAGQRQPRGAVSNRAWKHMMRPSRSPLPCRRRRRQSRSRSRSRRHRHGLAWQAWVKETVFNKTRHSTSYWSPSQERRNACRPDSEWLQPRCPRHGNAVAPFPWRTWLPSIWLPTHTNRAARACSTRMQRYVCVYARVPDEGVR